MTPSLAPGPWARPETALPDARPGARSGTPWQFASEVELQGPAGVRPGLQWLIKRNCSIAPRQLAAVYTALCTVSLLIAGLFYWQGAPFVLAFAGIELLLVGLALLTFARHAGDRETLTLVGRSMHVEQCFGRAVDRTEFVADWLTVEPAAGQNSLVQLDGQGQRVRVGRYLRPELRTTLARELRLALRRAQTSTSA